MKKYLIVFVMVLVLVMMLSTIATWAEEAGSVEKSVVKEQSVQPAVLSLTEIELLRLKNINLTLANHQLSIQAVQRQLDAKRDGYLEEKKQILKSITDRLGITLSEYIIEEGGTLRKRFVTEKK